MSKVGKKCSSSSLTKISDKKNQRTKKNSLDDDIGFARSLKQLDLRIKDVKGDGNCLFRSIADQLTGDENDWHVFRKIVVRYIRDNEDHFTLFMEDDEVFTDYVERMKKDGEWGGHPELYAASQCLRVNIVVHQFNSPRLVTRCQNQHTTTRDIHLSYHGECHYNSARKISISSAHAEPWNIDEVVNDLREMNLKTTSNVATSEKVTMSKKELRKTSKMLQRTAERKGATVTENAAIAPTNGKCSDEQQVEGNVVEVIL